MRYKYASRGGGFEAAAASSAGASLCSHVSETVQCQAADLDPVGQAKVLSLSLTPVMLRSIASLENAPLLRASNIRLGLEPARRPAGIRERPMRSHLVLRRLRPKSHEREPAFHVSRRRSATWTSLRVDASLQSLPWRAMHSSWSFPVQQHRAMRSKENRFWKAFPLGEDLPR